MKKHKLLLSLFITIPFLFSSCNNENEKQQEEKNEESAQNEENKTNDAPQNIANDNLNASYQFKAGDTLVWKGKHNDDEDFVHIGTVEINGGNAEVENGVLVAGEIAVNLTTLQKGNPRLDDHLKNDDFFNVTVFPNATFQLNNYENGIANGELTVIGITREISFPLNVSMDENSLNISGEFELDLLPFELPSLVKVENSPAEEKASGPSSKINIEVALTAHP